MRKAIRTAIGESRVFLKLEFRAVNIRNKNSN